MVCQISNFTKQLTQMEGNSEISLRRGVISLMDCFYASNQRTHSDWDFVSKVNIVCVSLMSFLQQGFQWINIRFCPPKFSPSVDPEGCPIYWESQQSYSRQRSVCSTQKKTLFWLPIGCSSFSLDSCIDLFKFYQKCFNTHLCQRG